MPIRVLSLRRLNAEQTEQTEQVEQAVFSQEQSRVAEPDWNQRAECACRARRHMLVMIFY